MIHPVRTAVIVRAVFANMAREEFLIGYGKGILIFVCFAILVGLLMVVGASPPTAPGEWRAVSFASDDVLIFGFKADYQSLETPVSNYKVINFHRKSGGRAVHR